MESVVNSAVEKRVSVYVACRDMVGTEEPAVKDQLCYSMHDIATNQLSEQQVQRCSELSVQR